MGHFRVFGGLEFGRNKVFYGLAADAVGREPRKKIAHGAGWRGLPLCDRTDTAGAGLNEVDAPSPTLFVRRERGGDILRAGEFVGEHESILNRHRCALAHVGRHRVRGVAQQCNAAFHPGVQTYFFEVVPDQLIGRSQRREEFGCGILEFGEECFELVERDASLRRIVLRRVQGSEAVHVVAAERHNAHAAASPPHFPGIGVLEFTARHKAPAGVARVLQRRFAEREPTNYRADSVGADDGIVIVARTVAELDGDAGGVLIDRLHGSVEANAGGVNAGEQTVVQRGAVQRDGASGVVRHRAEVDRGERVAARIGDPRNADLDAAARNGTGEADTAEYLHGVQPEHNPRADGRPRGGALDYVGVDAADFQGRGQRQPADAAADD